ncbi:MAG TPA: hypothetical protein VM935_12230 [Chitinophagaceae bacterium]|jgi:hypothetical protein|nr:hypothetical protein [Chitinophagaceae bacterium]
MKQYRPYITSILFLVLIACSPSRQIKFENKTEGPAEMVWVLKEDSLTRSRLFVSNSDTVRFSLHNNKPRNKLRMSFGQGSWTHKELLNFADDLEALQLKWNAGFIKLDSTSKIMDFLSIRRKGIDNSQISIVVK